MSYEDYPPINLFRRVLNAHPLSALIYAELWQLKPSSNVISIKRKEVKNRFLISPTLFRNHLLALGRLDLISFEEPGEFFMIKFNAGK